MPSCSELGSHLECHQESVTWRHPTWSTPPGAPCLEHPIWSTSRGAPRPEHPTWRHPCPKKDGLLASGGSQLGGDGASQGASLSCMPTVMGAR